MKIDPGQVKAILFDIDGTLFSSETIIHEIYRQEFQHFQDRYGLPDKIPALEEIVAQIGKPVVEIFAALAPGLRIEQRQEIAGNILKSLVDAIDSGAGEHYPGGLYTIRRLHEAGRLLFAASNGRKEYIEAILRASRSSSYFAPVLAVDGQKIHNKDQLVAAILKGNGLRGQDCLLVGDRDSDRQAALSSGIAFIACSFGHGTEAEHRGAIATIDSLPQLLDLLSLAPA